MEGWKVTDFAGHGDARVRGELEIDRGLPYGVQYTNSVPKVNYEIALQAMKRKGSDFFCGLTILTRKITFYLRRLKGVIGLPV